MPEDVAALSLLAEGIVRGCALEPRQWGRTRWPGTEPRGGLGSCSFLLCLQTSRCPPWVRGRGGAEGKCQGGTRLGTCLVPDGV